MRLRMPYIISFFIALNKLPSHDDVIVWNHLWPFVRGIHGHRGFPLTKASDAEHCCFLGSPPKKNSCVNNRDAGDLKRLRTHHDVTVMMITIKGSRTSDGIYVLQSLITRQVNLGQSLIVCSVDFSKAFDLINGDTLFYKIITHDPHGRVIDTSIDLYRKTAFRIKYNGRLSPPIMQIVGVNPSASPLIFREYMFDLGDYLYECTGVCQTLPSQTQYSLLLWADDLIMVTLHALLSAAVCWWVTSTQPNYPFWAEKVVH